MFFLSIIIFFVFFYRVGVFRYKKHQTKNILINKERELSREKCRVDILLDVGQLCSWQYSVSAGILKFDASGANILGETKSYYTYEELIQNRYLKKILDYIENLDTPVFDEEACFPFVNKWVIIRGRCIGRDIDGRPNQFIGIIIDNTERKQTLKKLEEISVTDELTKLKNRRFFFETFSRELNLYKRNHQVFSVAMLDLDYFKKINDEYGHLAGDYILKKFADLITREVRPYDVVARFGGEEFIIMFPSIDKSEAKKIVNRLKVKVGFLENKFHDQLIKFTFSCGIGDVSEIGQYTEEEFITIIDDRLYKAKHLGRNLIVSGG